MPVTLHCKFQGQWVGIWYSYWSNSDTTPSLQLNILFRVACVSEWKFPSFSLSILTHLQFPVVTVLPFFFASINLRIFLWSPGSYLEQRKGQWRSKGLCRPWASFEDRSDSGHCWENESCSSPDLLRGPVLVLKSKHSWKNMLCL